MGFSLQQWRIRVGTFLQHGPKQKFRPAMLTLGQKVFTVPLQFTLQFTHCCCYCLGI